MIEAKEILFIVLAFCALWVTVFFCWFVYQFAKAVKQINDVLGQVRDHIASLEDAITGMKSKFGDGAIHLSKVAMHMKGVVDRWSK